MPRLTSGSSIRPDLGAIAYEYALEASQRGFIGLRLMPIFETLKKAAEYPVIPVEVFLKLQETARASRSAYGRSDYEFEDGNYSCAEHGWEEPVDDTESELYSDYFDCEEMAVRRATDIILRGQEKRIADMVMNTGNFSAHAASVKWSTLATAAPRANVKAGVTAMRNATGLEPNVLVISKTTFDNAMLSAEIKDYIKYTNPILVESEEAQRKLLASYLGIGEILVGNAIYDSAKKGKALTAANIWPDAYGMLARVATTPKDLKEPCIGRTFLWTADSPQNLVTEQYREDQTRSNVYRVRQHTDECFVTIAAGYLLSNLA